MFKQCSNKNCVCGDKLQIIDNFYKNNKTGKFSSWCKDCNRKENKRQREKNKEAVKLRDKKRKTYFKDYIKRWKKEFAKYETFFNQINKFHNVRRDPQNLELIQIQCTFCKKWINPTNQEIQNRILSITGKKSGDNNIYCSSNCKQKCPIFNRRKFMKTIDNKKFRQDQNDLRSLVLKRDNYLCVKCGNPAKICHHIEGIEINPIESSDIDICISLCENCHNQIHNTVGCRRIDYACN